MILDSQVIEHLELTNSSAANNRGTLFSFIDHTNTSFGRRMLKRWLLAPLNDPIKLDERFNSVGDLISFESEA